MNTRNLTGIAGVIAMTLTAGCGGVVIGGSTGDEGSCGAGGAASSSSSATTGTGSSGTAVSSSSATTSTGTGGDGGTAMVYTIPGTGGMWGGGYLVLDTANGDVSLNLTCNYGGPGDDEAFFFANTPSVTAGSVLVTVDIQGYPPEKFDDLSYNSGGQDRAFGSTGYQGTWPWQGVFTTNEGGVLTQWTVTMNGSATGDCTAVVDAIGGGTASVVQP
jgi:hypothetical protein